MTNATEKGQLVVRTNDIHSRFKIYVKNCDFCDASYKGMVLTKFCSLSCKRKASSLKRVHIRKLEYKKWRAVNKEKRTKYMQEYRCTDKYREMRIKHDRCYRLKNPKKYEPRSPEQNFKSACRKFAKNNVIKDFCTYCKSTENLELHHSKGYFEKSIEGVQVVCRSCHRQVIHGRGTLINGS